MISPRFPASKLDTPTVDDLIDVFEDRINGWVLRPAESLMSIPHGGIAAFSLSLTYFEGIARYLQGRSSKGQSQKFFVIGFLDVFRHSDLPKKLLGRVADLLYSDARCGFFHDGMFRDRILFRRLPEQILSLTLPRRNGVVDTDGKIESIVIDPAGFLMAVRRHFLAFVKSLRDTSNSAAREKFFASFKRQCDWASGATIVAISET
jgi:hypothetical protein